MAEQFEGDPRMTHLDERDFIALKIAFQLLFREDLSVEAFFSARSQYAGDDMFRADLWHKLSALEDEMWKEVDDG